MSINDPRLRWEIRRHRPDALRPEFKATHAPIGACVCAPQYAITQSGGKMRIEYLHRGERGPMGTLLPLHPEHWTNSQMSHW
jgi:hypothetical protein